MDSESGHWYRRDGSPCYTVVGVNGKERNATLADARKLKLVPGASSISRCAASPGLERYKIEQGILTAIASPIRNGETEREWLGRVKWESGDTGRKAAQLGSEIHGALQGHFEGILPAADYQFSQSVVAVAEAIATNFPGCQWRSEQAFGCPDGYGGTTDLVSACGSFVLDFKTKEFDDPKAEFGYDDNAQQLAAYRRGLGFPNAQCANLFISRTTPGLVVIRKWAEDELARGWAMFLALLNYWKAKNKIETGWANVV